MLVSRCLGSGDDHGSFQLAPLNKAAKNRVRNAGSVYAVGQNARTRRLRSITAKGGKNEQHTMSGGRHLRTGEDLGLGPALEELDDGVDVIAGELLRRGVKGM